MMTLVNKPAPQAARGTHAESAWHQDCLVSTVILAAGLSCKAMKKMLSEAGYEQAPTCERPEVVLETMHVACHQDSRLIAAVSKHLNKKYRSALTSVKGMQPDEIMEKAGSLPLPVPLLWACFQVTVPEMRAQGRGLAHLILWRAIKRLLEQPRIDDQAGKIDKLARANTVLLKEIKELRKSIASPPSPKAEARQVPAAACAPSHAEQEIAALKKAVRSLERQLKAETRQKERLHQEAAVWRALALNREKNDICPPVAPVGDLQTHIPACPGGAGGEAYSCPARADCRECPLQGVKVAVIGGLERMETNYCEVVDRLGGQCLCHPGKVSSGCRRLRQVVGKADLVVFITTVNSHSAMSSVKSECKKRGKPFLTLGQTGAGSLEKMLLGAAA